MLIKMNRRPEAGYNKVMTAIEAALEAGYSCDSEVKSLKVSMFVTTFVKLFYSNFNTIFLNWKKYNGS